MIMSVDRSSSPHGIPSSLAGPNPDGSNGWGPEPGCPQADGVSPRTCLHQRFEQQVRRSPESPAIASQTSLWSYGELNACSNQIAHGLRDLQPASNPFVAVLLDGSPLQIAVLLGILKAGGAFVCLDSRLPVGRVRAILDEVNPRCLITNWTALTHYGSDLTAGLRQSSRPLVIFGQPDRSDRLGLQSPIRGQAWLIEQPTTNLNLAQSDRSAAYLVYTSGTTGQPKGILQTHRSVLPVITWFRRYFQLGPSTRLLQWAGIGFDPAYVDILATLCCGATLCVTSHAVRGHPRATAEWIKAAQGTVMQVVPSFFRELIKVGPLPPSLQQILFMGEAVSPDLWRQVPADYRYRLQWFNLYGPTEAILATCYPIPPAQVDQDSIPVGWPLADREILILDDQHQSCGPGQTGDIYIRSPNLAPGYFRQPHLTRSRFGQNPLHCQYPDRVYHTGDRGYWRPDGSLAYLGRQDRQVKVRGMRVELDEIEAVLRRHPQVQECAVVLAGHAPQTQTLTAFIGVARESASNAVLGGTDSAVGEHHLHHWQTLFDATYQSALSQPQSRFNTTGWTSSYTQEPLTQPEMQEWVETTIQQILSWQPRRVLEIGCGAGLLLFKLAPHCRRYLGTDFSASALQIVRQQLDQTAPPLSQVSLRQSRAHDFSGLAPHSFDTVILNSITQYFPSIDYLMTVLEGALRVTRPGGTLFVGDVRDLRLAEAFYLSVELHHAQPSTSTRQLWQAVQRCQAQEEELLIDPAFFQALPQHFQPISHVEIQPRRGRHQNEMTCFRYQVILRVAGESTAVSPPAPSGLTWLDWQQSRLCLPTLRQHLLQTSPASLALTQIPDARLQPSLTALSLLRQQTEPITVEAFQRLLQQQPQTGVDPEALWQLGQELSYTLNIYKPTDNPSRYSAVLQRQSSHQPVAHVSPRAGKPRPKQPWAAYGNHPLRPYYHQHLIAELREFLQPLLPTWMIPARFVIQAQLPRTLNHKIDRQDLTAIAELSIGRPPSYPLPQSALEQHLARLWTDLLNLDRVGVHDNFFELGGQSLSAIQLVHQIDQTLNVNLSSTALFEAPTIAQLIPLIQASQNHLSTQDFNRSTTAENSPSIAGKPARVLLDQLETLPDATVDELLKQFIKQEEQT